MFQSRTVPMMDYLHYAAKRFLAPGLLLVAGLPVTPANAGVLVSDVTAGGMNATAVLGLISGNDEGKSVGENLLNSVDGKVFSDSLGLTTNWTFKGSTSGAGDGISTLDKDKVAGTLNLSQAITGPFVVSLKAGPSYALYFFNSTSPITSLEFSTQAFVNGQGQGKGNKKEKEGSSNALSHASLYTTTSTVFSDPRNVQPTGNVPEPTTLAIWSIMGICGIGAVRGKRLKRA